MANEASCAWAAGDVVRSRELCDSLDLTDPHAYDFTMWRVAVTTKSLALSSLGLTHEALALAERAIAESSAADDAYDLDADAPMEQAVRIIALTEGGRLDDARTAARQAHASLVGHFAATGLNQRVLSFHLARAEWLAGHPMEARRWYAQVASGSRPHAACPLATALAGLTAAAGLLGDVEAAEKAWAERCRLEMSLHTPEEMLGQAWLSAARGEASNARRVLSSAAREARNRNETGTEALLLTDLARLGGAREAAGRLKEIAATTDSPFHEARALFATAWANEDPEGLVRAGEQVEALGADLLAAEAYATAAAFWEKVSQRPAQAAAIRSRRLADRCEGARSPALVRARAGATLTGRELEIGMLAAQGLTSRDIADRLTISVRTVDNHLHRIYHKLGITTRQELTAQLNQPAP
ncbi:response regulator transcription factor [Streptomyces sp. NPDC127084]|uniref:helix-turn-helix transcriptional regulator n=1 Tax=Streptomyces sp. NPDC127084 TaxID=3347133 RepID=UPI003669622C